MNYLNSWIVQSIKECESIQITWNGDFREVYRKNNDKDVPASELMIRSLPLSSLVQEMDFKNVYKTFQNII